MLQHTISQFFNDKFNDMATVARKNNGGKGVVGGRGNSNACR